MMNLFNLLFSFAVLQYGRSLHFMSENDLGPDLALNKEAKQSSTYMGKEVTIYTLNSYTVQVTKKSA